MVSSNRYMDTKLIGLTYMMSTQMPISLDCSRINRSIYYRSIHHTYPNQSFFSTKVNINKSKQARFLRKFDIQGRMRHIYLSYQHSLLISLSYFTVKFIRRRPSSSSCIIVIVLNSRKKSSSQNLVQFVRKTETPSKLGLNSF